jgi:hypothetical protein
LARFYPAPFGRACERQGVNVKIDVCRKMETSEAITGEFWLDGLLQCYYLEPSRFTPYYPGHPCIPAGIYRVALTMSPHLGYVCPEVLNVPERTSIRWHIGNFPRDVLGCCVVGTVLGENSVAHSRIAFRALMEKLRGNEIVAEYRDPAPEPERAIVAARPSAPNSAGTAASRVLSSGVPSSGVQASGVQSSGTEAHVRSDSTDSANSADA